jgi:hypothetical protein
MQNDAFPRRRMEYRRENRAHWAGVGRDPERRRAGHAGQDLLEGSAACGIVLGGPPRRRTTEKLNDAAVSADESILNPIAPLPQRGYAFPWR